MNKYQETSEIIGSKQKAESELLDFGQFCDEIVGKSPYADVRSVRKAIQKGVLVPVLPGSPNLFTRRQASEIVANHQKESRPTDDEFGMYFDVQSGEAYLGMSKGFLWLKVRAEGVTPAYTKGKRPRAVFTRPMLDEIKKTMRGSRGRPPSAPGTINPYNRSGNPRKKRAVKAKEKAM